MAKVDESSWRTSLGGFPVDGDFVTQRGAEVAGAANALLHAANPLLNLLPQIRAMVRVGELSVLRDRLVREVREFEQRARMASVPQDQVVGARYCLCTVLDEAAAQAPWGCNGEWAQHSLLVTFHNETWGGEKYFQLLSRLAQNPQKHLDLLELMYFCIALGYMGRFHVLEHGRAQLETLRQRLTTIIQTTKGERERALSPHWRGVVGKPQTWRVLPVWVVAALCAVVALVVYGVLAFWLAERSDPVFAKLAAIDVPAAKQLLPATVRVPPARVRSLLEAEIREGLVVVADEADRSVVTIMGDGLFDSGKADVKPSHLGVLTRIASALNRFPGTVVVTGYTDNVPSRSVRFPSNWHLSQARAATVAAMLTSHLTDAGRVRAEGKGEAQPIADNKTPDGRARNRRVEVALQLPPRVEGSPARVDAMAVDGGTQ